jgi:hypothetical protein
MKIEEMMYEELGQEKDKTHWASTTRIKSNKNTGKKKLRGKEGKRKRRNDLEKKSRMAK